MDVFDYPAIQQRMLNLTMRSFGSLETLNTRLARPPLPMEVSADERKQHLPQVDLDNRLSAFGWGREDREWVQELAKNGIDPISSLGFDGPLASLSTERQNIADYFKEAVAVVTNPAIDREREVEHFSTQTIVGSRPPLVPNEIGQEVTFTLETPILLDSVKTDLNTGYPTLDQLTSRFPNEQLGHLQTVTLNGETTAQALERLAQTAIDSVRGGAKLILLDDSTAFQNRKRLG